jgi:hypothetical protein
MIVLELFMGVAMSATTLWVIDYSVGYLIYSITK